MISVVLPIHNERPNLGPLLAEITEALRDRPHEVVAVDDGSTDGSGDEARALRRRHPQLRVVSLAARAGQSAALAAGWDVATGDVVVTLDADGQNDPADIPPLVTLLERDPALAAVVGYRTIRADSRWKRIQSGVANAVRNWVTGDRIRDTGCGLKAVRRAALVRLPRFDGMHRFLPTLLRLQGGVVLETPVSHRPRRFGETKYGMWDRLWRGLRDAFGVRWLRHRPLRYEIREENR